VDHDQHQPSAPGLYLVERYLAAAAAESLPTAVARLAALCDGTPPGIERVRYLHSTYLPTEDTCFCLFRASSSDAVRVLNDAAALGVDRVTPAVVLHDASDTTRRGDLR
jgi:uncharacterized protein DUF4242